MYKITKHSGSAVSIVAEFQRTTKPGRKPSYIRTRALVQIVAGKAMVIRGSLILGRPEIDHIVAGIA